jgi:hypothetical protein
MSRRNKIKGQRNRCPTGLLLFALVLCVQFGACLAGPVAMLKGALLTATQADDGQLRTLKAQGYNSVVLSLSANATQDKDAAHRIQTTGFNLYYWIEIARNPALADSHPEWMASLQGHQEWRRFFPDLPKPAAGEVVKNYPWVPVFYQEAFAAHLKRVKELLQDKPAPRGIFLNDLQGAPSACGCGNHLCRWTSNYGPIKTATPLGADAAAKFVAAVKKLAPESQIVPVWLTECEEQDHDELCAGIPCFKNTCWREWTAQLMPVASEVEMLGALLPYRALQRDLTRYGPEAGWIKSALVSFTALPARYQVKGVPHDRLVAVLQGWDVTPEQINSQITRSSEAGTANYVVSMMKIEQDWKPVIVNVGGTPKE